MINKTVEKALKDTRVCNTSIGTIILLRCITIILYDIWKRNYDTKPKGKKQ